MTTTETTSSSNHLPFLAHFSYLIEVTLVENNLLELLLYSFAEL